VRQQRLRGLSSQTRYARFRCRDATQTIRMASPVGRGRRLPSPDRYAVEKTWLAERKV